MIRSNIDFGSVVYSSANKTLLKKIKVIQNQALRICCGAFRSSPVASLQVEMGELPEARQDLVFEVLQSLFRIRQLRIEVNFLRLPAHVGVDGNEEVDLLAKKALNHPQIEIKLALSKAEFKRVISFEVSKKLQKLWNSGSVEENSLYVDLMCTKCKAFYGMVEGKGPEEF